MKNISYNTLFILYYKNTQMIRAKRLELEIMSKLKLEEYMYLDNDLKKDGLCSECHTIQTKIEDYARGIIICPCGQVSDYIFDDKHDKKNEENETFQGSSFNPLLQQSSLGSNLLNANKSVRTLHMWNSMPYKERSDNIMFKEIQGVCDKYNVVKKIGDDAKILCKKFSNSNHTKGKNKGKPIITRGFNRAGIVAACLYIACRRNDDTRNVKEIATYFQINDKDVNRGIKNLTAILEDDDIIKEIGSSKIIHFINRKCTTLGIKMKDASFATKIATNIEKLNIGSNHTTFSLAAASILLMVEINGLKDITKTKISEVFCELTDITIGKTYAHIKKYKTILIDDTKVDDILKNINNKKKKTIISQEVYDKMIQFDIDTSPYIIKN